MKSMFQNLFLTLIACSLLGLTACGEGGKKRQSIQPRATKSKATDGENKTQQAGDEQENKENGEQELQNADVVTSGQEPGAEASELNGTDGDALERLNEANKDLNSGTDQQTKSQEQKLSGGVEGFDEIKITSSLGESQMSSEFQETLEPATLKVNDGMYHSRNPHAPQLSDFDLFVSDHTYVHIGANDREYAPINTMGVDPAEMFTMTDFQDDPVVARLIQLAQNQGEELANPQFVKDSKVFAQSVQDIEMFTSTVDGHPKAHVRVKIIDGRDSYVLSFKAPLDRSGTTQLTQTLTRGEVDHGYRFRAFLTCLDRSRKSCNNAALVLEQVIDGQICKRVFAVVRNSKTKLRMDDADYVNRKHNNSDLRQFMAYFQNTVHANRMNAEMLVVDQNDPTTYQLPFMARLHAKSFAVVYGYSAFEIRAEESFYSKLNKNFVDRSFIDGTADILVINGPSSRAQEGKNAIAEAFVTGHLIDSSRSKVRGDSLSNLVKKAYVVGNDGRGEIEVKFEFRGNDSFEMIFLNIEEPAIDPQGIIFYPHQGVKFAPEEVAQQDDADAEGAEIGN